MLGGDGMVGLQLEEPHEQRLQESEDGVERGPRFVRGQLRLSWPVPLQQGIR